MPDVAISEKTSTPQQPPRHIVAVSGLVTRPVDNESRVLLLRGPRRGWEFPGGQVEEGESITDALVREIREETGVEAAVGALVGVYSNLAAGIVMLSFLCDWLSGEPHPTPEALEVAWVERDQAAERVTHPALRGRLEDMLRFEGRIVYRAYSFDAGTPGAGYTVHEERLVGER